MAVCRAVPGVEDQVDDRHDRAESVGQLGLGRHPVRDPGVPDLAFARTKRWAIVESGMRNARAISGVCSPPSSRSVRAICASVDSAG